MLITIGKVGGAITSGKPASWAAPRSRYTGFGSPIASANSASLTRLTS